MIHKSFFTYRLFIFSFIFILTLFVTPSFAGPPYDTDDPEPVELHHWEIYASSRPVHDVEGWSGTAPHFEVNYGAVKNLQLHVICPCAFNSPNGMSSAYGFGDMELGMKYRFVNETSSIPQIGIFPLVELPTGNQNKGLGNGETQISIPLWLQKTFGRWTSYGGAGYWFNPGNGNKNWLFIGWQIQDQLLDNLSIGAEVYHNTPQVIEGASDNRFNFGMVFDVTDHHHILFSAGRGFNGPVLAQVYIGYQLTLGPAVKQ